MKDDMADVTLHIDQNTSHEARENFRDALLGINGVMAAAYHDEKPHLMVVAYNPNVTNSGELLKAAQNGGLDAELIGL